MSNFYDLPDIKEIVDMSIEHTKIKTSIATSEFPTKRLMAYTIYNNLSKVQHIYLTGLRKVGKTTILSQLCEHYNRMGIKSVILDCDMLNNIDDDFQMFYSLFACFYELGYRNIFIDEACKVKDYSGLAITLHDFYNYRDLNVIVTGSSIPGIRLIKREAGRGTEQHLSERLYIEHLLMNQATSLDDNPYNFENASKLNTVHQLKDFLYYKDKPEEIEYISSCINDTLKSLYVKKRCKYESIEPYEIMQVLNIIAYSQMLELSNNVRDTFSVNLFRSLCNYLKDRHDLLLDKSSIDKLFTKNSDLPVLISRTIEGLGKDKAILIISLLIDSGIISVQVNGRIKTISSTEIVEYIIKVRDLDDLVLCINTRALTMYIYKVCTEYILNNNGIFTKISVEDMFEHTGLNLKGTLLENYLFTNLNINLPYHNVCKYRHPLGLNEIDLVIENTLGIEVKK